MKDERKQCKKHHESTIGKIIYGFLLFLPLFAIGSACLISTFNMASKEESEIHYKYETNEVNSNDDLIIGRIYHFKFEGIQIDSHTIEYLGGNLISINQIYLDPTINEYLDEVIFYNPEIDESSNYLYFQVDNINCKLYLSYPSNYNYINYFIEVQSQDCYLECDILLSEISNNLTYEIPLSCFSKCENIPIDYVETHNVSAQDVFYDSVDKVQQSPLFNWTTNTGIYTVLNNTCNSLGITTTFVPLLLAYWLIISVMYFLYDIVLIILNILHRKIHEVQESI